MQFVKGNNNSIYYVCLKIFQQPKISIFYCTLEKNRQDIIADVQFPLVNLKVCNCIVCNKFAKKINSKRKFISGDVVP